MRRVEVDVLVVGAGPVGLTASLLLARHGLTHRVVDRRPGPHRAPQAHVVNPRSLEIFRQMGIDTARLRRLATPREDGGWVAWNTTLAGMELGRLPYERHPDRPRACVDEGIGNGRLIPNGLVVDRRKTFDDGGGVADHITHLVQPALPVEVPGLDNQRSALPSSS